MRSDHPRPMGIVFIPGATAEQAHEMQQAALTPEGTLMFRLNADQLYQQAGSFTVLEIPTGATLHWVTRDAEHRLRYVHATPGTGTREAVLDLPDLVVNAQLIVALVWSASSTRMSAGFDADDIRQAEGVVVGTRVRVTPDGVYVVGDAGVEVAGYQVFVGGKPVLQETAIEIWEWTETAVDVHMRGAVVEGEKGKVVQANLALVMLATGFEVYCDRRFAELPQEGRAVDVDALALAFVRKRWRTAQPLVSLEDVLAVARIDFGNYGKCRDAYKAAYQLRFASDTGLPTRTLGAVGRMLRYRHRIVHVSPLVGLLNQPWVPPEKPEFSGRSLVEDLWRESDRFVHALHEATLRLT